MSIRSESTDKQIAVGLGWYVYQYKDRGAEFYMLVAPHERPYTKDDYTWLINTGATYTKNRTEQQAWDTLPHRWSSELTDAWDLWHATPDLPPLNAASLVGLSSEDAALAICQTWLQHHYAKIDG